MKTKIKPITFQIQTTDGVKEIDGYAVDTNLPIRLCVHPVFGYIHLIGWWSCSHYDTGLGINESKARSMKKSIRRGVAEVLARQTSGEIERVLDDLRNERGLA